jgi:hypothetical protein
MYVFTENNKQRDPMTNMKYLFDKEILDELGEIITVI